MTTTYKWTYRPTAHSARHARLMLRYALEEYPDDLVHDIRLIVTELLTNCLRYGKGPVVVTLRITKENVVVQVSDKDPVMPEIRLDTPEYQENGRGMSLVMALPDHVGISARERVPGKVTWAVFNLSRYIRRLGDDVRDAAVAACGR